MEWLSRVDDRVVSIAPRIDAIAPSPDGALLAVFPSRASDPDFVRRERVYVIERATGREVVTLDGPEIFRALAWVGDDALLVLRDHPVRGAWVRLHAIPDGGVERALHLDDPPDARGTLSVAEDLSRCVFTPTAPRGSVPVAWALDLPTLTVLARVTTADTDDTFYADLLLHPEGTHLLGVGGFDLRVIPLPGGAFATTSGRLPNGTSVDTITWLSRRRVLATPSLVAFDDGEAPFVFDLATGAIDPLTGFDGVLCADACAEPDRRGVAITTQPRRDAGSLEASLRVLDVETGAIVSDRPWRAFAAYAVRVRWWSDGTIVTAGATSAGFALARWSSRDGGPTALATVAPRGSRSTHALAGVGEAVVMLSHYDLSSGSFVDLVEAAP
ncbi:MAG: hypothetical protein R3A52_09655 [Polyangiales bacterium]